MDVLYEFDGRRYVWDERKAAINLSKHGIAFEDAVLVFRDPRISIELNRGVANEERLEAVGQVNGNLILFVIHTVRYEDTRDERIRIIYARRATGPERRGYWQSYLD
jgi:uncharacterized DUF497 family protein